MKLKEANWKVIHFEERTILKTDKALYPKAAWEELLNTEIVPMKNKGHYKAIAE